MTRPRPPRRGTVSVELAVALPLLLLLLCTTLDHAYLMFVRAELAAAGRAGARAGLGGIADARSGVPLVAWCDGGGDNGSAQLRAVRAAIAATARGLLWPDRLCLAPSGPVVADPRGEPFIDLNGDGVWTPREPLADNDANGRWSPAAGSAVRLYSLTYRTASITGLTPGLGRTPLRYVVGVPVLTGR